MATSDTTTLNLSDQRGPEPGRRMRDALAPFGNGKGEWLRFVLGVLFSVAAGVFAAWVTVSVRIAVIEERQSNQNSEVLRRLDEQNGAIRDLRDFLMRDHR